MPPTSPDRESGLLGEAMENVRGAALLVTLMSSTAIQRAVPPGSAVMVRARRWGWPSASPGRVTLHGATGFPGVGPLAAHPRKPVGGLGKAPVLRQGDLQDK